MSLLMSVYYGQLISGCVCGVGITLCLNYLINNKNGKNEKECLK